MTTLQVEIHPDRAALVARSLTLVTERIRTAITERGTCALALAGGSTPKPLYEALAQEDLPWAQLHIFWGDERYVPVEHPDSNAGMAKAAWLDQVPIPAQQVHITPTHFAQPAEAAAQYEQTLRQAMGADWPSFDIVLLGIGDDAHTASLFPHTAALKVSDRLVTVGEKSGAPRITFTAPLINQSRCVIFLVSGHNKQTALTQIFAPEASEDTFPARKIRPQGELWWLLDSDAGEAVSSLAGVKIFS
ncbi:MAG: 6-phosphogluconolactonase [Leptolyngbya sp. SIO1E4]|nr:6-phosphogluconolactonase [Leptolyngbya sp. SIO1E4]